MGTRPASFRLDDADIQLIAEYADALKIKKSHALRLCIRSFANGPLEEARRLLENAEAANLKLEKFIGGKRD